MDESDVDQEENKIPAGLQPIQKGMILNPKGRIRGTKSAKVLIRDFMDNKIETLKGTRVTRFQYLLYSMYEINLEFMKQLEMRKEFLEEAKDKLNKCKQVTTERIDLIRLEDRVLARSREYEKLLGRVHEHHGKFAEFFLKATGQYLEKKEINNISEQPLLIAVSSDDLKEAIEEINDELG